MGRDALRVRRHQNRRREPSAEEIIEWCRQHMGALQVPKTIIFGELPRPPPGKIQKNILRDRIRAN